ncbi:MAG TPA: hypothetical protein VKA60_09550 [Blastocatellia bacterium]|nr:hypothetical protein [Blastocatellia bacterium]
MTEDAKYFYRADPGETVTLKATITGDAFVAVGQPMQPAQGQQDTWTLSIPNTGFSNPYIFKARVDFVQPPPGSKVDFAISGSKGGSFTVFPIDPTSFIKQPTFTISINQN